MTDFLDPTDIYCRLRSRRQTRQRVTARQLAREYGAFRRTPFGVVAESYLVAIGLFALIVTAWRALA